MNAHSAPFDRTGSTLGIMDDVQFAIHSYDGCARGCSGCVVDKHFKNKGRGTPIIPHADLSLISDRVRSYYAWAAETLNGKDAGYFGKDGYKVGHYSYTFRFGNHAELPMDELVGIAETMPSDFRVFSVAPTEEVGKFATLRRKVPGNYYLEIIYDPVADDPAFIRAMILDMRSNGILGYPEVLVTRRLLDDFPPERFVEEALGPISDLGTQLQFGRYTPSRTRGFRRAQVVPVDEEVEWLAAVARGIIDRGYDIHPIPLGEYAVTLLDEYGEMTARRQDGIVEDDRLPDLGAFDPLAVREKTRDIFLTSLYVDHKLDLYVWSESVGQHVLDRNFGFEPLGNIREKPIEAIVTEPGGQLDRMLSQVMRMLLTHRKCGTCRYKSFCASHAVPLFRKFQEDDGKHCYGYIPVIREYQRDLRFLDNMVRGFKELGF